MDMTNKYLHIIYILFIVLVSYHTAECVCSMIGDCWQVVCGCGRIKLAPRALSLALCIHSTTPGRPPGTRSNSSEPSIGADSIQNPRSLQYCELGASANCMHTGNFINR